MKDDQILIEDYVAGRLTSEQNQAVEARTLVDLDFAAALKIEDRIYNTVSDHQAQAFLQKTREVMEQTKSPIKSKTINIKGIAVWLIAASVALLLGSYFLSGLVKAPDNRQLYAEYFDAYPMVLSQRGPDEQRFQSLIQAYDQFEWTIVEQELSKLSATDLPAPLKDLYRAIALMEQNKANDAVTLLKTYLSNPTDLLYQNTIEWYLALAYLKLDDSSNTKIILKGLEKKVESNLLRNRIEGLQKKL